MKSEIKCIKKKFLYSRDRIIHRFARASNQPRGYSILSDKEIIYFYRINNFECKIMISCVTPTHQCNSIQGSKNHPSIENDGIKNKMRTSIL